MKRILAAAAAFLLTANLAHAQWPPVGSGTGTGSVEPAVFSSPAGTGVWGGSTNAVTFDVDTSVIPLYSTGTSDPVTACAVGGMFHYRTDSSLLKLCTAVTPTWTLVVTDNRIPACADTGGNHLNFSSGTWSCGTSGGSSGVGTFFAGNFSASNVSASTTTYISPTSTSASTEVARNWLIPAACTARNLYVVTSNAQSGTGAMVVTLRKNGAATAVTLTITAGAGAGTFSDTSNTVSFAAADLMALEFANAATAGSAAIRQFSVQCN